MDEGASAGNRRAIPNVSFRIRITLRSAQVRRISWVRGVRLAGARLSGLLVSAALRPATLSGGLYRLHLKS